MNKYLVVFLFISLFANAQKSNENFVSGTIEYNSIMDFPSKDIVFSINAMNNTDIPFSLSDVLKRKTDGSLLFSVPNFFSTIDRRVDFRNETRIGIFNLGYKIGAKRNNYISLSNEFVGDVNLDFNRDFLDYIIRGNSGYLGKHVSQKQKGMGFVLYRSLALGYVRQVKPNLQVGLKVKYLTGIVNVNLERFNFDLYTSDPIQDESFYTQIKYDLLINTSGLTEFSSKANDKNIGYAFDLAVEYKCSNNFTITGAVKDLGLIHWHKSNNLSLQQDSLILVESLINNSNSEVSVDNQLKSELDSLTEAFKLDSIYSTYTTNLPVEYYLQAHYLLSSKAVISSSFLSRSTKGTAYNSLHFEYQHMLFRWLKAHVYYSVINSTSYSNYGIGLSVLAKNIDLHLSTYNIMAADLMAAEKLAFQFSLRFKFNRDSKDPAIKFLNYKNRF